MRTVLLTLLALAACSIDTARAMPEFQVIAYHDVRDHVRERVDADQ